MNHERHIVLTGQYDVRVLGGYEMVNGRFIKSDQFYRFRRLVNLTFRFAICLAEEASDGLWNLRKQTGNRVIPAKTGIHRWWQMDSHLRENDKSITEINF